MNLNDLEALSFTGATDASETYNILNTLKQSILGFGQKSHDNEGHNLVMQGVIANRPTSADFELPVEDGDFALFYWSTDELVLYLYDGQQWRNASSTRALDVSYTVTGYDTITNVALALDQLFTLLGTVSTDAESITYEFSGAKYLLGTSGNVEDGLGLLADWAETANTTISGLEVSVATILGDYGDLTGVDGATSVGLGSGGMSNITASNVHDAIVQIDNLFSITGVTSADNISYTTGSTFLGGVINVGAALNLIDVLLGAFPDRSVLFGSEESTVTVGLLKKFVVPSAGYIIGGWGNIGVTTIGADMEIQVRLNNAVQFTVTIAIAAAAGSNASMFAVVEGDVVQFYVSQVGSTRAGSNLAFCSIYEMTRNLT